MPPPVANCPKCGREVVACGTLAIGGVEAPVYQCPECLMPSSSFGEVGLTFCIDAKGRPVDPAEPDKPLVFKKPRG